MLDYVRQSDSSPFVESKYNYQILTHIESLTALFIGIPPKMDGPALHRHHFDQLYYILEGEAHVQLGTETHTAPAGSLVHIPKGTAHHVANKQAEWEYHLELVVPTPSIGNPNPIAVPVDPEDAGKYPGGTISRAEEDDFGATLAGENYKIHGLAGVDSGSEHVLIYETRVSPGAGGPPLHIHDFDQFYYVLGGTMHLQVGFDACEVGPNTFVVLPAGVPHRNWNEGPEIESHIAILAARPSATWKADSVIWDQPVVFEVAGEVLSATPGSLGVVE